MTITRRRFLQGCSAAITAMSGSRLHSTAFGNPCDFNQDVLISIFLRGGADVLNLIPPTAGPDRGYYETERPTLHIPGNEILGLDNTPFGLHPAAQGLHTLYGDNKLAIVQATGIIGQNTRSHFDAMANMELGIPDVKDKGSGWMTRHLQTAPQLSQNVLIPAVATGQLSPTAFLASTEVATLRDTNANRWTTGPYSWRDAQRSTLRRLYSGDDMMATAGYRVLETMDIISAYVDDAYTPANNVIYPESEYGNQLQMLARLIKSQVGLRMATIDLGGWDTHNNQGIGSEGSFARLVGLLSDGLTAFYNDLNTSGSNAPINRVTVVVMSEFGRKLRENADRGSDHGHGGAMLVLGGAVNGGMHGVWPGLQSDQLYDRRDLAITTDYRQVLSEILIRRHQNPNIGTIFPSYSDYSPLGIVQGDDLTPTYFDLSEDGFGAVDTECSVPLAVDLQHRSTVPSSKQNGVRLLSVTGAGAALTAGLIALRNRT